MTTLQTEPHDESEIVVIGVDRVNLNVLMCGGEKGQGSCWL